MTTGEQLKKVYERLKTGWTWLTKREIHTPHKIGGQAMSIYYWYNFNTGKMEAHEQVPQNLSAYIPNIPGARGLFDVLQEMDSTPEQAAVETMRTIIGKSKP